MKQGANSDVRALNVSTSPNQSVTSRPSVSTIPASHLLVLTNFLLKDVPWVPLIVRRVRNRIASNFFR